MKKLEELRAALEAATQGEWEDRVGDGECVSAPGDWVAIIHNNSTRKANNKFITLAHNMMPLLLEAVEMVKWCYEGGEMRGAERSARNLLEKFK